MNSINLTKMAGTGKTAAYTRHREMFRLPVSRIRTIMKSSPEVENIQQHSLFLVSKATEFFIQFLAREGYVMDKEMTDLEYKGLAEFVQMSENLAFLREIMPRKMKYGECLAMIERAKALAADPQVITVSDDSDEEEDEQLNDV